MALWNGRFRKPLHPRALRFSSSLHVDRRLFREDIAGSIAHVRMLAQQKIIPSGDATKIQRALRQIEREIAAGKLSFDIQKKNGRFVAEDIHMAIEERLIANVGSIGGKLHTARSRNDQIALDERLYLRKAIDAILKALRRLQRAYIIKAERYKSVIVPGYTHLQRAQPILLAHHLLAYVSMLERDHERFCDCMKRVNRSPLGAGALAGSSFAIDRAAVARSLKFDGIIENSIDAVSDRDVQIEFLGACAITMMHLSRFAEELVLWSTDEWNFAEIGDAFTTGSSIMPQKKNPDMAELVRGKTGRVYGDLVSLLTVMKGLPLAYNRDMQEDKEPLFDAADTLKECLDVFTAMMKTVKFDRERFEGESDFLLATDLADYLVRKGMPFRKAHATVGAVVSDCIEQGISIPELPLKIYRKHSKLFSSNLWKIFHLRASIYQKKSAGSTSPKEVEKALLRWKKRIRRA
ncbi:MAG: argininosuccinate lyase [Ignavibacteriae bacterium]|nr:argininosuccinate lyase [Ignavibacteriota bacterium]